MNNTKTFLQASRNNLIPLGNGEFLELGNTEILLRYNPEMCVLWGEDPYGCYKTPVHNPLDNTYLVMPNECAKVEKLLNARINFVDFSPSYRKKITHYFDENGQLVQKHENN